MTILFQTFFFRRLKFLSLFICGLESFLCFSLFSQDLSTQNYPLVLEGVSESQIVIANRSNTPKRGALSQKGQNAPKKVSAFKKAQGTQAYKDPPPASANTPFDPPIELISSNPCDQNAIHIQLGFLSGMDGVISSGSPQGFQYSKNQGSLIGPTLAAVFHHQGFYMALDYAYIQPFNTEKNTQTFQLFSHDKNLEFSCKLGYFLGPSALLFLRGGYTLHYLTMQEAGGDKKTFSLAAPHFGLGFEVSLAQKVILGMHATTTLPQKHSHHPEHHKISFQSVRFKVAYNFTLPKRF